MWKNMGNGAKRSTTNNLISIVVRKKKHSRLNRWSLRDPLKCIAFRLFSWKTLFHLTQHNEHNGIAIISWPSVSSLTLYSYNQSPNISTHHSQQTGHNTVKKLTSSQPVSITRKHAISRLRLNTSKRICITDHHSSLQWSCINYD